MKKVSERVHVMKSEFMALHQAGYSIAEIASRYELSVATVYRHLQEIADENRVNRETLLEVVHTPTERQLRDEEKRTRANVEEMKEGFTEVNNALSKILDTIDMIISEEEK